MRSYRRDEEGSYILVLLVAVLVGGLVAVLYIQLDTGISSTRQDRDYALAFHAADTGIQEAYATLLTLDPEDPTAAPPCGLVAEGQEPCVRTDLGADDDLEWTYERAGVHSWVVDSYGTHQESTRRIVAEFSAPSLFEADITALDLVSIRGNITGLVSIASFCDIDVRGDASDYVEGSTGIEQITWLGDPGPECTIESNPSGRLDRLAPFPRDPGPQVMDRAKAVCENPGPGVTEIDTLPESLVRGTTYCTRNFGSRHDVVGPGTEPVKVYVYREDFPGDVIRLTGNNARINSGATSQAGDLEIYISNGGGDVLLGGSSEMVASVYAPFSTCDRRGNGLFRGAWFCRTVNSRGGFEPDPTARSIRDGDLVLGRYSEEFPQN